MSENNRNKKNGQYSLSNLDAVCTCGDKLGDHMAEWPHPHAYDDGKCDRFTKKS